MTKLVQIGIGGKVELKCYLKPYSEHRGPDESLWHREYKAYLRLFHEHEIGLHKNIMADPPGQGPTAQCGLSKS